MSRNARAGSTPQGLAVALAAAAVFAACGGGESGPTEMTTGSTQAAITASQVTDALTPALNAAAAAVASLPTEIKAKLTALQEQKIVATLQQQLSHGKACVTVEKTATATFKVTYAKCSFTAGSQTLAIDGSATLAWSLQLLKGQATLSATFDTLTVNDATIDGSVSAKVSILKGRSSIATSVDLTHTEGGTTRTIKVDGTMSVVVATATVTLSGKGSVDGPNGSYTVTVDDVVVKATDGAPSSGSVAVSRGKITVKIVFSASTVSDGTFTVYFNGVSFGQMSVDDLVALLTKLSAQP